MNDLRTNEEEWTGSIADEDVEKRRATRRGAGAASVVRADPTTTLQIRFEQAEDEYAIASIASTPYVKRTPAIERSLDAVKADESLQRTIWRARKISADDDFVEREKKRKRYVSTNATAYVDERSKALLLNHKFALEPSRSTRRAEKLKRSNFDEEEEEEEEEDAVENDAQKRRIAHLIAAQVDEIKRHMPSSSLMECVHHASSHYYDARRMPQKVRRKKDAAHASFGMEGACEGSALVALAVFIEELAAWESSGKNDAGAAADTERIVAAHHRLEQLRTIRQSQRPQQPSTSQPQPSDEIVKRRKRDLVRDTTIWAYDLD